MVCDGLCYWLQTLNTYIGLSSFISGFLFNFGFLVSFRFFSLISGTFGFFNPNQKLSTSLWVFGFPERMKPEPKSYKFLLGIRIIFLVDLEPNVLYSNPSRISKCPGLGPSILMNINVIYAFLIRFSLRSSHVQIS